MLGLQPEERGSRDRAAGAQMFSQGGSAAERAARVRRHITSLRARRLAGQARSEIAARQRAADHDCGAAHRRSLARSAGAAGAARSVRRADLESIGAAGVRRRDGDRPLDARRCSSAIAGCCAGSRAPRRRRSGWRRAASGSRTIASSCPAAAPPSRSGKRCRREGDARAGFHPRAVVARRRTPGVVLRHCRPMTPERMAHAFGPAPIGAQIEQARALYSAFRSADSNWKLEEHPFLRGMTDPWIVVVADRRSTARRGAAGGAVVLGGAVRALRDLDAATAVPDCARDRGSPVTLAWLAQKIVERRREGAPRSIRDGALRARRVRRRRRATTLPTCWSRSAATAAIARCCCRSIAWRSPRRASTRAASKRRAGSTMLSGRDASTRVIAFQASIAILERARLARAIDAATAERTLLSLADLVETDKNRRARDHRSG